MSVLASRFPRALSRCQVLTVLLPFVLSLSVEFLTSILVFSSGEREYCGLETRAAPYTRSFAERGIGAVCERDYNVIIKARHIEVSLPL